MSDQSGAIKAPEVQDAGRVVMVRAVISQVVDEEMVDAKTGEVVPWRSAMVICGLGSYAATIDKTCKAPPLLQFLDLDVEVSGSKDQKGRASARLRILGWTKTGAIRLPSFEASQVEAVS